MRHLKYIYIPLIVALLNSCAQPAEEIAFVILEGKIVDRESKTLILKKSTENAKYQGIEIPISDSGNFRYEMKKPEFIEEYELVFMDEHQKGVWRPIPFFPESDTIQFELYPMNRFDENQIRGSELSKRMKQLELGYSSTFESVYGKYYFQIDSLSRLENDNKQEIESLNNKIDSLNNEVISWKLAELSGNADLFSYIRFIELLKQMSEYQFPTERLDETLSIFKNRYPDHPYTTLSDNLLGGIKNIQVGGSYIDFVASDSSGNEVIISTLLNNRITLIDLWAPWCGPCIKKSQEVQKVYSEINPLGFDVVGVVGGIKNEDQYFNAIRKYNYPWNVLFELQDVNRIWEKYNISNSGGSQFLINEKGKIIAINPSIEQIKEAIGKS